MVGILKFQDFFLENDTYKKLSLLLIHSHSSNKNTLITFTVFVTFFIYLITSIINIDLIFFAYSKDKDIATAICKHIQKHIIHIVSLLTPSPLSHLVIIRPKKVIYFRAENEPTLDIDFRSHNCESAEMCIFSTQNWLSKWKVTLNRRWSGVIQLLVIAMQLLKQYFIEGMTSLFDSYPLPLCHTLSSFLSISPL